MASQSQYPRIGRNPRLVGQISANPAYGDVNSDEYSGQSYTSIKGMGPPPLDSPPQPVEIDLNSSRTLPSPSPSSYTHWDPATFQAHGFADMPPVYGSSHGPKIPQSPMEGSIRGSNQDPLLQWYTGNDGPWIPKGISEIMPEERIHESRQTGNRFHMPYGSQCRPSNQSEPGNFQYGASHSDSGYGTRRSVGNTSVFSADITERDQDCPSLAGPMPDFQAFQGLTYVPQPHGAGATSWTAAVPRISITDGPDLFCPTCQKQVKTRSELKKHDARHKKPFVCKHPGCPRTEGFSTTNDLDRHIKSKHPSAVASSDSTKRYRCLVQGCKSKDKSWPRLDNFRNHLKRVHQHQLKTEDDFEDIIRQAEFWGRTDLDGSQDGLSSQGPPLQEPARPLGAVVYGNVPNSGTAELDFVRAYPEMTEPPQDLVDSKESQSEDSDLQTSNDVKEMDPPFEGHTRDTVQPLEVFGSSVEVSDKNAASEGVVLAPVGLDDSAFEKAGNRSPQPTVQASNPNPQGKTPRQNDASATDAAAAAVFIRTALAGVNILDAAKEHAMLKRTALPEEKPSSEVSWPSPPSPGIPSTEQVNGHINHAGPSTIQDDSRLCQAQIYAIEVLKAINDMGYILQKDPKHSPKAQNPGSAASLYSNNKVTCQTCKRFTGRRCELTKHMKRHERPYGCTFLSCNKTFGSKNDWKRHENSQHFHLETWRCDEEKPQGGTCAKVCYRRQTFQEHLKRDHQNLDGEEAVKMKVESCRMGRNGQARFWCGFCITLIDLKKKGLDAWKERFDHIDDHFMGRHGFEKKGIQDWIPVDSDKPKGDVASPQSVGASPAKDSHETASEPSVSGSSGGNSPKSMAALGGPPTSASIPAADYDERPKKRQASSDDGDRRSRKRLQTQEIASLQPLFCCRCGGQHNPKIDESCTMCETSHRFCESCYGE